MSRLRMHALRVSGNDSKVICILLLLLASSMMGCVMANHAIPKDTKLKCTNGVMQAEYSKDAKEQCDEACQLANCLSIAYTINEKASIPQDQNRGGLFCSQAEPWDRSAYLAVKGTNLAFCTDTTAAAINRWIHAKYQTGLVECAGKSGVDDALFFGGGGHNDLGNHDEICEHMSQKLNRRLGIRNTPVFVPLLCIFGFGGAFVCIGCACCKCWTRYHNSPQVGYSRVRSAHDDGSEVDEGDGDDEEGDDDEDDDVYLN